VRRFDKHREGRKTSNTEWVNPHDPEGEGWQDLFKDERPI
jgi:hypothetical protein